MELIKTKDPLFNEYYVGIRGGKKVICILDDYCVRYIVFQNGKKEKSA